MGYGGSLIWTAVVNELHHAFPDKEITFLESIPTPLEQITGGLFNRYHKLRKINQALFWERREPDTLFAHNPHITPGNALKNKKKAIIIDRFDPKNSYIAKDTPERFYWVKGSAIAHICKNFGVTAQYFKPELYFSPEEEEKAENLTKDIDEFVVIEPHSKTTYTINKAWFFERWQTVTTEISKHIPVVQIGEKGSRVLDGVIDLTGTGSFRDAAAIIQRAEGFACTEGGLVHAARAVGTKSVVLFSCVAPVELMAYPDNINIYHHVACGPTGLKTTYCARRCMERITSQEIIKALFSLINNINKNI